MSTISRRQFRRVQDRTYEALSNRYVMILLTVVPVLALLVFINFLPIVWAIVAGFFRISPFSPQWEWVGLANYEEILADPDYWGSMWKSVVFAGGSVALQIVFGTGLALLINREFRFNKLVRAVVMLPYLIPTAVLALVALWMGNSQWGVINRMLVDAGLVVEPLPFYGSRDLAMLSVIVTNSWKFSIFVTIMVLARLQGIPDGYYEAAEVAGANAYQRFRDITLPNLQNVLFIVILLRGIWMFNKFDILWVLTKGGPGDETTTAPVLVYETAFNNFRLGEAMAMSMLLFVLLALVAVTYFRVFEPEEEVRVE